MQALLSSTRTSATIPRPVFDEPTRLDTLQVDLGVIGPAAGGEFVQNNFHTLIGVSPSYGWGNQLHNEPTVGLTFERRWRTGRAVLIDNPKLEVDFIPRAALAVGNVATYGSVAARRASARTCATTSGRPGRGRRCQDRTPLSATAVSAGTCSRVSTARRWPAHLSRRKYRWIQPAGLASSLRRGTAGGPGDPLSRHEDFLHADSAYTGVLRTRPHHAVRLVQPHIPLLTRPLPKGSAAT